MQRILFRPSIIAAAVSVMLAALLSLGVSASSLYIVSNGVALPESFAPIFTESGFAVPIELASEFGAEVAATGDGYVVRLGGREIRVTPEAASLAGSGAPQTVKPIAVGGSLFLPLQFMANFLNLKVSWDVTANRLDLSPWTPLLTGPAPAGPQAEPAAPRVNLVIAAPSPSPPVGTLSIAGDRSGGALRRPAASLLIDPPAPSTEPVQREWPELFRATGLTLASSAESGLVAYRFTHERAIEVRTAVLVDPFRLVVDVEGVPAASLEPLLPVERGGVVQSVRTASNGGNLRLVFDLAAGVGHRVERTSDTSTTLYLYRPMAGIDVKAGSLGGRVRLGLPGETRYEVRRLTEPARAVIDLYDTTLLSGPVQVEPEEGPVARVRAAQFQPEIARVVMDLKEGSEETDIRVMALADGLVIEYGAASSPIAWRRHGEREAQLHIAMPQGAAWSSHRLSHPDRIVVDVTPMRLEEAPGEGIWFDGPVSGVRVSQFDRETVRIVVDLRRHVRYGIEQRGQSLILAMEEPLLAGRSVTIDAGHGGRDGGAVGVNLGILEKDINLDIARILGEMVRKAEGTAVLTRVDDTLIDLWSRPAIALEAGSDVFVSVHSNSVRSPSETAKGTETYVNLSDRRSVELAQAIHGSLVSTLGTIDRGIRDGRRLLVLRDAKVPAVLVEVAFLSHPEEEELLNEPWFRRYAAEGIFNGLLKFFNPSDRLSGEEFDRLVAGATSPWLPLSEAGSRIHPGGE